jgi:hypothetical protein
MAILAAVALSAIKIGAIGFLPAIENLTKQSEELGRKLFRQLVLLPQRLANRRWKIAGRWAIA